MQVYELSGSELALVSDVEKASPFKCGSFGASSLADRHMATGNFAGRLQVWDLEVSGAPLLDVQAHASIVNQLDAFGGQVRRTSMRSQPGEQQAFAVVRHSTGNTAHSNKT
jgi:WD repeat-containing protein 92